MGKAGNVCMLLGTALVLAALSLFLWNQREAAEAGRAAEAVLPRLVENMEAARTKPTTPDATLPDPYDPEMTVVEIDGRRGWPWLPATTTPPTTLGPSMSWRRGTRSSSPTWTAW